MHTFLGYDLNTWSQFLQVAQDMWQEEYTGYRGLRYTQILWGRASPLPEMGISRNL
jgi:hypothetical protein